MSSIFGRKPYGHKRSQSEREKQRAFPDIIKNVDFSEFEESVAGNKVRGYEWIATLGLYITSLSSNRYFFKLAKPPIFWVHTSRWVWLLCCIYLVAL